MRIAPASGCSKPARSRSSVVLPQPEGPSRVRNSPGRTSSETSRRARTSAYDFETPWTDTAPRRVPCLLHQLLQRLLELLQHLVHDLAGDGEGGLDADGLGVQERPRHEHPPLEEPRRHRVAELRVHELEAEEEAQTPHLDQVVGEAPLDPAQLGEEVLAGDGGL